MKYRNLDLVEERTKAELGEYKFYKAAKELGPKYGSYEISDKDVLVAWKGYNSVYVDVAHQLPTNLFLDPMREGVDV